VRNIFTVAVYEKLKHRQFKTKDFCMTMVTPYRLLDILLKFWNQNS